jgi:hypothetical protein
VTVRHILGIRLVWMTSGSWVHSCQVREFDVDVEFLGLSIQAIPKCRSAFGWFLLPVLIE